MKLIPQYNAYEKEILPQTFVLRFCYTYGKPVPSQSFDLVLKHKTLLVHLDEQGYSQALPLEDFKNSGTGIIDHFEMLDLKTGYPTHKQIISVSDLKKHAAYYLITITVLPPPILIDLSLSPNPSPLLSPQQIQYLKDNGQNALIFIHGYNLPLGHYGCYPEHYDIQPSMAISEYHLKDPKEKFGQSKNLSIAFKKSSYARTIACNLSEPDEIIAQFPSLFLYYQTQFSKFNGKAENNPEGLGEKEAFFNGTDARHWFTHMEYNVNRAAGFHGNNYQNYTRTLNIYWPCGNGLTEFREAERMAVRAAEPFLKVIQQLIEANICIHIMAHSLGCRLVLEALRILSSKEATDAIEHIILWQAAIPHTSLYHDPDNLHIHKTTKKITVLHSKQDSVLRTLFTTAYINQLPFKQALGYAGPKPSALMKSSKKSGKLICVDQSSILLGHSFMKLPTAKLMREIYQEYIIGGAYGIQAFGHYKLV